MLKYCLLFLSPSSVILDQSNMIKSPLRRQKDHFQFFKNIVGQIKSLRTRIHIFHQVSSRCADDVIDSDDVFMFEAQQDLDLSQGALTVRLVLEGADLLNGHAYLVVLVIGRAVTDMTTNIRFMFQTIIECLYFEIRYYF